MYKRHRLEAHIVVALSLCITTSTFYNSLLSSTYTKSVYFCPIAACRLPSFTDTSYHVIPNRIGRKETSTKTATCSKQSTSNLPFFPKS
ncbi:hypothetical protein BDP55DRAFT_654114 [Colletotrichum godetiae]|uniref:Uncharacterized protein n=1 Tax=Colletotrichum godetiae TaxID=1209918 RepID=A0AAJ0AUH3_9PEZI|nr:uncharacterized protein BDP55DRAFT_654114 [Colletotrichum godetiae]KAK1689075.1 hypothetical protein BDP55DRAFT_654114 [Colletotrichum godetiae]